jgi:hypothetical protein
VDQTFEVLGVFGLSGPDRLFQGVERARSALRVLDTRQPMIRLENPSKMNDM